MEEFCLVAKSKSGQRVLLCCQWWGVCVGRVDYLRAMACLAAEVLAVSCWCTFLLWCKAVQCSRRWPTKNCIQEQITADLLFTHMGQPWWQHQVPFPQKKSDRATGTCWPHVLWSQQMQGNVMHINYNQAHWYPWQSAGIQRVLPTWCILFMCRNPHQKYLYLANF